MNIEKLITNGENKRVEFKEQLPKNDSIAHIKSSCLEVGLKEPLVRELNDFVDVEFYRPNISITVGSRRKSVG